jgi:excisionase family DNA binding protein
LSEDKKVYCEVVEGVTYASRCLWRLSKVIEGNSTCEGCILRQLERLKSLEANISKISFISNISKTSFISQKSSDVSGRRVRKSRSKRRSKKRLELTKIGTFEQVYGTGELSQLLGKAERTLQEWAQKGKIPAMRVGIKWQFPREEIDRWLAEKKDKDIKNSRVQSGERSADLPSPDLANADQGEPKKEE